MIVSSLLNLGGADLLVVLIIVLLLFGAKKLPDLGRGMGHATEEFLKAKDEFEHEIAKADPVKTAQPMSWTTFAVSLLAVLILVAVLYSSS